MQADKSHTQVDELLERGVELLRESRLLMQELDEALATADGEHEPAS